MSATDLAIAAITSSPRTPWVAAALAALALACWCGRRHLAKGVDWLARRDAEATCQYDAAFDQHADQALDVAAPEVLEVRPLTAEDEAWFGILANFDRTAPDPTTRRLP